MHNKNLNANQGKETQLQGKWNIKYSQKPIHDHCFCAENNYCVGYLQKSDSKRTLAPVF